MTMSNNQEQHNQERRDHDRRDVEVTTTITVDSHHATLKTKDLSKGGAFLKKGDAPLPPEGTELFIEISAIDSNDDPIVMRAEVVRVTSEGIGIIFLE